MQLSKKATDDLRIALAKSYGKDFEVSLSDEEVEEIGSLLLNILAESLKIRCNEKCQTENKSTVRGSQIKLKKL